MSKNKKGALSAVSTISTTMIRLGGDLLCYANLFKRSNLHDLGLDKGKTVEHSEFLA